MGLLVAGAAKLLFALQATQAAVTGIVRDGETGVPLAGTTVVLADLDRSTTTDAAGRYLLLDVPAGPQHLTIRFLGYVERTLHALVPPEGRLDLNVTLRPDPFRLPTIEVRGKPPAVVLRGIDGDSAAFPDRETSSAAAGNDPRLAERDPLESLGGGAVVLDPESPSGLHVRGSGSDQIAYLLDGMPVFNPYHAAGVFSAWNPDALSHVRLSSGMWSPADPAALAGTVAAVTRAPGVRARVLGGASTTQARLTIDGPLGVGGAGYLISARSGFPAGVAPVHEASYLRGETADWLVKLEAPVAGGRARLLGYVNNNELDAAAAARSSPVSRRNTFAWYGQSFGVEWRRPFVGTNLRLLAWNATSDAASIWTAESARLHLASSRRDAGLLASVERATARIVTVAGLRVERIGSAYRVVSDSVARPSVAWETRTPVVSLFAQQRWRASPAVALELGASAATTAGTWYWSPHAQLRWTPTPPITWLVRYARTHQFAQSLRNAESVVGHVFPADLYVGAGAAGVPVARADEGVLAVDTRPFAGARFGVQAYARVSDGLVLVAPRGGEPFGTGAFAVGGGTSRGVAVEAALSGARYGLLASYGFEHVQLAYGDSTYVPNHAATHRVDGGLIVFPAATLSIRLGATAAFGRRTTTITGPFEWEACNLLDRGCEFGGSPRYDGQRLGATSLPTYLRVDLGFRKHWHVRVGGRHAVLALFGTVTNVFGRANILTYARDSAIEALAPIEMRPLAPLVVGLDWQF